MTMYLDHFGLKEAPFGITPDTDFTYAAPAHRSALATLLLALRSGEGFVKLTGEVGTGKTLLCRTLLDTLRDEAVTAYVPNPRLTPREMLQVLAGELDLRVGRRCPSRDLYVSLEAALVAFAHQQRPVVLCIDEAQAMPVATLEALRLLSNIETGKRKLLQIVMFAQPELDATLASASCRSMASRITFAAELGPMGRPDFERYLRHRLAVAGWRGPDPFTYLARRVLWLACRGVPRRANILAHKCLMLAYGEGGHRVGLRHAWYALRDSRIGGSRVPLRGQRAHGASA